MTRLKDPVSSLPIKKPTWVYSTSMLVWYQMNRQCVCTGDHQTLEGKIWVDGRKVARTKFCENYNDRMAESLGVGMVETTRRRFKPFDRAFEDDETSEDEEELSTSEDTGERLTLKSASRQRPR